MRTYVVNLERSKDRKEYMENQLSSLPYLLAEFVCGVDGRLMDDEERREKFNVDKFCSRYHQRVRPGEIGCTLSHQRCYRKLLDSGEKGVLILEDDIIVNANIEDLLDKVSGLLDTEQPLIVLLSGRFMYTWTRRFCRHFRLANVFNASFTHAYAINRAAAELLVVDRPDVLADDWNYIRRKGVSLKAVLPHVIDQNWSGEYATLVNGEELERMGGWSVLWLYRKWDHAISKFLKLLGRFEKE